MFYIMVSCPLSTPLLPPVPITPSPTDPDHHPHVPITPSPTYEYLQLHKELTEASMSGWHRSSSPVGQPYAK